MSQAQTDNETCQHCGKLILYGQPICRLLKAVFHAGCLAAWCAAQMKGKRDVQEAQTPQ